MATCKAGFYGDDEKSACLECNALVYENTCVSTCPDGYYSNDKTCEKCKSPCKTCEGLDKCGSCETGYLNANKVCSPTCPSG